LKPAWPGPIEGGITQSLIGNFLDDPYRAYLYYGEGLEEPSEQEPNLHWGNGFHLALEHVLRKQKHIKELTNEEYTEIFDIVKAFLKETCPKYPATYPHSICRMMKLYDNSYCLGKEIITEQKLNLSYTTRRGRKCTLRGKADVYCPNEFIAEHKCKGKTDAAQTRVETPVDLQSLLYCKVLGVKRVHYDLIRIPESQWKQPTVSALASAEGKVKAWFETAPNYDDWPINAKAHLWLTQLPAIDIPDENIDNMTNFTLDPIIEYIWSMYDLWCEPSFDAENPDCYGPLFYRTPIRQFDATRTEKYKCKYHSYLTGQLGKSELVKVTSFYKELDQC